MFATHASVQSAGGLEFDITLLKLAAELRELAAGSVKFFDPSRQLNGAESVRADSPAQVADFESEATNLRMKRIAFLCQGPNFCESDPTEASRIIWFNSILTRSRCRRDRFAPSLRDRSLLSIGGSRAGFRVVAASAIRHCCE